MQKRRYRKRKMNHMKLVLCLVLPIMVIIGGGYFLLSRSKPLEAEVKKNAFILPIETDVVETLTVYGEQLLINYNQKQQETLDIKTTLEESESYTGNMQEIILDTAQYTLVSGTSETWYSYDVDNVNASGLTFSNVENGIYYLLNSDETRKITTETPQLFDFTTVRRNGESKLISIDGDADRVEITVTENTDVSIADIVIDPGHGNVEGSEQPGACSEYINTSVFESNCEREVMLEISQYLQTRLENHGYVVAMTRETEDAAHEPTGDYTNSEYERDDWDNTKADEVAKTTPVLESGANLSMSLHYNSYEDGYEIMEIYESIFVPDFVENAYFSQYLYDTIPYQNVYLFNRDYCFQMEDDEEDDEPCVYGTQDYYYMNREYGGSFTHAKYYDNELIYGEVSASPEAILIELFNGQSPSSVYEIEEAITSPYNGSLLEQIVEATVTYYDGVYQPL